VSDRPLGSAAIAQEIKHTRQRLSRSLARLDRDYALRHLVVRAGRMARSGDGANALPDALRRDAVPLAIIGVALGWLTFGTRGDGASLLGRFDGALGRLQALGREFGLLPGTNEPPLTEATTPPEPPVPLSPG
jgi:hypothetical protein